MKLSFLFAIQRTGRLSFIAAQATTADTQAKYDFLNPTALKKLVAGGAKLKPYPKDVMEACFKSAKAAYEEISAGNAAFKKAYESMSAMRARM